MITITTEKRIPICTTCGHRLNKRYSCEPCTISEHTPRQTNGIITEPVGWERDHRGWGY